MKQPLLTSLKSPAYCPDFTTSRRLNSYLVFGQLLTEVRNGAIMRWGLIPRWAKPDRIPERTFNARSETVAEKPTFRDAWKKRRCVIPVSGYYEWTGEKGSKQPFYFHPENNTPLLLAGLWEDMALRGQHRRLMHDTNTTCEGTAC